MRYKKILRNHLIFIMVFIGDFICSPGSEISPPVEPIFERFLWNFKNVGQVSKMSREEEANGKVHGNIRSDSLKGKVFLGRKWHSQQALVEVAFRRVKEKCNFDFYKKILFSSERGYSAEWTIRDEPSLYRYFSWHLDPLYNAYVEYIRSKTDWSSREVLLNHLRVVKNAVRVHNNDSNFVKTLNQDINRTQLILDGVYGVIRKMRCLESIPMREYLKVNDLQKYPQEFVAIVFKKTNRIKILADLYFLDPDSAIGASMSRTLKQESKRLQEFGWEQIIHLHNHPFNFSNSVGDIGGGLAPSKSDLHFYASQKIPFALITNGLDTLIIEEKDYLSLERLDGY